MEEKAQSIWDFDRIASCSAIFIALIAMVVALYEARVNREHQEISVWPSLIRYNSSIPKVGDRYMNFGIYIKNNGIGPAVIKKITYKHESMEYENLSEIFYKVAGTKIKNSIRADKSTLKVLLPGEERLLLGLDFAKNLQQDEVFKGLSQSYVTMEFCYCSLYNQCWRLNDNNESLKVNTCN